jgi:hypothetical protein
VRVPKATVALIGICFLLIGVAGCSIGPDRAQQLFAAEGALGNRYEYLGPSMINHLDPVGADQSVITQISANSAQRITLISATLITLPGFRTPQLLSTGVIAANCRQMIVLRPAVGDHPSVVDANGHEYKPLALRGYSMEIGAGCVPQIVYVVRAKSTGQYAVGGLRVLVRHDGHIQAMDAVNGMDIWYYNSSWLPTANQVTDGLRATFAAQVALYRRGR